MRSTLQVNVRIKYAVFKIANLLGSTLVTHGKVCPHCIAMSSTEEALCYLGIVSFYTLKTCKKKTKSKSVGKTLAYKKRAFITCEFSKRVT
jgi:hypothetical protein